MIDHFRFLKWEVYLEGKKLFREVQYICRRLSTVEKIELGSQLIRSSFSVILNIAEGAGKRSDKELRRYLGISIGSLTETIAGLDVFADNNLIKKEEFANMFDRGRKIADQLEGFKANLRNNPKFL